MKNIQPTVEELAQLEAEIELLIEETLCALQKLNPSENPEEMEDI